MWLMTMLFTVTAGSHASHGCPERPDVSPPCPHHTVHADLPRRRHSIAQDGMWGSDHESQRNRLRSKESNEEKTSCGTCLYLH